MKSSIKAVYSILLCLTSASALAADAGSARTVSVGAGISSPARTSAHLENPAGLTLNEATRVQASAYSLDDSFDSLGLAGGIFFGNGNVGGAAEITRTPGDSTELNLGIGAQLSSLSLGAAVNRGLESGGGWNVNVGAIFNPKNKFRIGALLYGVTGGIDGIGAGLASSVSSDATIAVEAATDGDGNGLTVKPALGIDLKTVQLVFGYGIEIDDSGGSPIREGFSLGAGLQITQSAHLVGYYNQLSEYHLSVIFKL